MASNKPNWQVRLNVDGRSIMTVRTDEKHAKRVAQAFGFKWEGKEAFTHWPLSIHKIGSEVELEQQIMSKALSTQPALPSGEIMFVLVGKERAGGNQLIEEETMPIDKAIKLLYEATENLPLMDWALIRIDPGTTLPPFEVSHGTDSK